MRGAGRVLALLALLAVSCRGANDEEEQATAHWRLDGQGRVVLTPAQQRAIDLETARVKLGSLTTSALRFGKVVGRPQEDGLVVAPVTGRLLEPKVSLGAHVSAGQELVALQPLISAASRASLEAQRRELEGQIQGARAEVTARQADLQRVSALVASGLATQADKAQVEAQLTAEQARARSLERAGSGLTRTTGGHIELKAPVDGTVATLKSSAGALVEQGSVLARIIEPGPRWIDLAVPPGDPVGSAYRVHGTSRWVSAKLLSRGIVVGADGTRRDRLEAPPDAAADLLPGATVPVDVERRIAGVLVPASAVVRHERQALVFVESLAGHYAPRHVQVGAASNGQDVVTSGLGGKERVVTRGGWALIGELSGSSDQGAR